MAEAAAKPRRRLDGASLALLLIGLAFGGLAYWLITNQGMNPLIITPSIVAATTGATHISKRVCCEHAVPERFRAVLARDDLDGGWIAECTDLPGCMSQGKSPGEAVDNLLEAIREVLAVRTEQGATRA